MCSKLHVSLIGMCSTAPESNGYLCDAAVVVLVVVVLLVTQQVAPVVNASAACTIAADAASVAIAVDIAGSSGSTHTGSTGADVTSGLQSCMTGIRMIWSQAGWGPCKL